MKILSIILLSFTLLAGGLFAADVSWISQAQAGDDDHDEHEEEHEDEEYERIAEE